MPNVLDPARRLGALLTSVVLYLALAASGAHATDADTRFKPNNGCVNTGPGFSTWMRDFRREALANGIPQSVISSALDGITLDESIIRRDRGQSFFAQSFLSFSKRLASNNRLVNGRKRLDMHKAAFARAEREYGVPPPVITAFWALESDFGVGIGKLSVLRSLATLAWDCRRGPIFREQLTAALKIIQRGDLSAGEMVGSWAGELGQTQFLPTHYLNHAVDWDGDGRRNLMKSAPDIIGSSAAFIKSLGWRRGEPWLEEVKIPDDLPWQEADLTIRHPRSWWAARGVTRADGSTLPADDLPAALLILQSRFGPAFLAYPNFDIYTSWNHSLNYATTAAYLATRIAGAPPMNPNKGGEQPVLSMNEVKDLQQRLNAVGIDAGEADGKVGAQTRAAVRAAQIRFDMPADSYPTKDLLLRLNGTPDAPPPIPPLPQRLRR